MQLFLLIEEQGVDDSMKNVFGLVVISFIFQYPTEVRAMSFYEFQLKTIQGKELRLKDYQGKVVLVVNTASKCGYTKQYEGLENLYKELGPKGLVVLGVPSNDFGKQEPGTEEEIQKFCKLTYGVSFPMTQKMQVLGEGKSDFYRYLTSSAPKKGEVKWNFEKFLINRAGQVVGRFESAVAPGSTELSQAIQKELTSGAEKH